MPPEAVTKPAMATVLPAVRGACRAVVDATLRVLPLPLPRLILPLACSAPVMPTVLPKVAAPAADKTCTLVLPPPKDTVMPPADTVSPPLTARPPDAVSSPATDSVLLAAAPARMTRVLVLLVPSTVLPCTVRPPDRLRLVAVRLLCSSTGAMKLATALTVRRYELLAPMVVLDWTFSVLECSVGELTVSPTLVPALPITVAPA